MNQLTPPASPTAWEVNYLPFEYEVTTIVPGSPQGRSEIRFSLPYADWCLLKSSPEWAALQALLERPETRASHLQNRTRPDEAVMEGSARRDAL